MVKRKYYLFSFICLIMICFTSLYLFTMQNDDKTVNANTPLHPKPFMNFPAQIRPSEYPSAPQSLTATFGNGQIVLNWMTPTSDGGYSITNYYIYRGTTSGGETLLTTVGVTLTYTNTGLTNGQTYYYEVSAYNSYYYEGLKSNEATATPMTVPGAPQSLMALSESNQINLTWGAPVNNGGSVITNYKVYVGTTSGGEEYSP
ncbi:MAG TPA: fibronectin type III domain-containing protein [Candidatus Lokiarchaeia archaeon]|nr:fibronectin type III domain-containing protein [Candidatus Lokiarchaeia archaeon]